MHEQYFVNSQNIYICIYTEKEGITTCSEFLKVAPRHEFVVVNKKTIRGIYLILTLLFKWCI